MPLDHNSARLNQKYRHLTFSLVDMVSPSGSYHIADSFFPDSRLSVLEGLVQVTLQSSCLRHLRDGDPCAILPLGATTPAPLTE